MCKGGPPVEKVDIYAPCLCDGRGLLDEYREFAVVKLAVGNLCRGGFDIYISILVGRFSAGAKYRDMKDGLIVYE